MSATYVERTGNIIVHHPVKPRPTTTTNTAAKS